MNLMESRNFMEVRPIKTLGRLREKNPYYTAVAINIGTL